jgi:hypothetical protein
MTLRNKAGALLAGGILAAGLAVGIITAAPASASAYTLMHSAVNSSYCAADPGNNLANGTVVRVYPCNSGNEAFLLQRYPYGGSLTGYYSLVFFNHGGTSAGYCIDDPAGLPDHAVVVWTCNGGSNQAFLPIAEPGGWTAWREAANSDCINLYGGHPANGGPVYVWTSGCNPPVSASEWAGPG